MTSEYLYQKTIEGFLGSLNRLGKQQLGEQQSARSSVSPQASAPRASQDTQSASLLSEKETQILEEAVADIEQTVKKQPKLL